MSCVQAAVGAHPDATAGEDRVGARHPDPDRVRDGLKAAPDEVDRVAPLQLRSAKGDRGAVDPVDDHGAAADAGAGELRRLKAESAVALHAASERMPGLALTAAPAG